MSGVRVSVVMAVYNGCEELPSALDSILGQECAGVEYVFVDDGSTDGTGAALDAVAARDGRVRVLHVPHGGLTLALRAACEAARGTYIARQDAGDVSYAGRLARQAALLDGNPQLLLCSCWARMLGPGGEVLAEIVRPTDPIEATRGLLYDKQGPPAHGTVMFRKDAYERVGGYREEFYYAQDSDLWLRMAAAGRIGYVPDFLYEYQFKYGDISFARKRTQTRFGVWGQAAHKARLAGRSEAPYVEKARRLTAAIRAGRVRGGRASPSIDLFIGSCLLSRGDARAIDYLVKAVHRRPWSARGWIKLWRCRRLG